VKISEQKDNKTLCDHNKRKLEVKQMANNWEDFKKEEVQCWVIKWKRDNK